MGSGASKITPGNDRECAPQGSSTENKAVANNIPAKEETSDPQVEEKNISNGLHVAAKIGDVSALLHALLANVDPWQRDEFDSLPVYYGSLYGHILCCALLLIKMGGADSMTVQDKDRCTVNALNLDIKALFNGDLTTHGKRFRSHIILNL